jgi:hypothetical protein
MKFTAQSGKIRNQTQPTSDYPGHILETLEIKCMMVVTLSNTSVASSATAPIVTRVE